MDDIKQGLIKLPIYAADFQEKEMALMPATLRENEVLEAAVSVCYRQIRGLFLLTSARIIVICASANPVVMLDLPIEKIESVYSSAWYGTGNIHSYTSDDEYFFSLMSMSAYVPLANRIQALANDKRKRKEQL